MADNGFGSTWSGVRGVGDFCEDGVIGKTEMKLLSLRIGCTHEVRRYKALRMYTNMIMVVSSHKGVVC